MARWFSGRRRKSGDTGWEVVKGGMEERPMAEMGMICSCLYFIDE